MTLPDSGSWSPRRTVEVFVASAWIVAVLLAWGVLRLTFMESAARTESSAVAARMERATAAVNTHVQRFEHAAWALAAEPALTEWLRAGAEFAPPGVLTGEEAHEAVVVQDNNGIVRSRRPAPGVDDAVLAAAPNGTALVWLEGHPVLTFATPVAGGRVVVGQALSPEILDRAGVSLGLSLAYGEQLVSASTPTRVEVFDEHTLGVTSTIPIGDGTRALQLTARAMRPIYAASGRASRLLLVGFAAVAGLLGLLAMRSVPRVMLRESDRRYSEFVENSGEGILLIQPDTLAILHANPAVCALLRRERAELTKLTLPEVLPMCPAAVIGLRGLYGKARIELGEVPFAEAGRTQHLEVAASQMMIQEQQLLSVVIRDVTARHVEAEHNRHLAWHDPLTGLPNRSLFQARLREALAGASARGEGLGVAFIDVDQFKNVNDDLGHDAADRLLVDVAARLRAGVREGDVVARQGGDEFLILFPSLGHRSDAVGLAERVLELFRHPFHVDGRELHLTASLGIAAYPDDGAEAADLVKHADMAMFQAKEAGRDGWQLYDAALRARTARLVETRTRLTHALERGELFLNYQPQLDLRTGELVGVEALIRWRCDGKLVPPLDFIPVAEQSGLIGPIGAWVLEEACRQAKAWQDAGLAPVRMAVNLSARQFLNGCVVEAVDRALSLSGLAPEWLEVEITESLAMRNPDGARRVLQALRARGITVALDDFGTGYSSLAYLRQFPIDRLKIDRAFLAEATVDPQQRALVAAIITLAHALHLEVVAEGIETGDQLRMLHGDGCDLGQGFGLSRPVSGADVARLLHDRADLLGRLTLSQVA